MTLTGLVMLREPPENRRGKTKGGPEQVLAEAAVMLAFALWLFDAMNAETVEIHPDGEHGKRFDIRQWLEDHCFQLKSAKGGTSYGGVYVSGERTLVVHPKPGLGDVVAEATGGRVVAECKGGILNTTHAGQLSRLRSGLCEAVGMLMARSPAEERHLAVVPRHGETEKLARKLVPRARTVGISIALVSGDGSVEVIE